MNIEEIVQEANKLNGYGPSPSEFGEEFDALVYKTFHTVAGKELLYFMEKNMLMKAIWNPLKPGWNADNEKLSYFFEGRNDLVRLFKQRIAIYSQGK